MKISIIFHSVCGNTYFLATYFYAWCIEHHISCSLYRVYDEDLPILSQKFPSAKEVGTKLKKIPVVTPNDILDNDYIIMGSPTYFGNVSAEMKAFMDACSIYWVTAPLVGKKLIAFTTASNSEGGGDLCLQAIHTFGQHMGMTNLSLPPSLAFASPASAYGFLHYTGNFADDRPTAQVKDSIYKYMDHLLGTKK